MPFDRATLTRKELQEAFSAIGKRPHGDVHKGKFLVSREAFETPGRETNLCISRFAFCDLTGNIHIGPWCMFGARSRVYTHDHIHAGRKPLLATQENHGVLWQDKYFGADVWIHDSAIVLYQVTHVPDGVVLGAGSVLTKNPGPYEIWAGVPARKVGERKEISDEEIALFAEKRGRFLLKDTLADGSTVPFSR